LARRLRRAVITLHSRAGGHLGGSLSPVEVLSVLFLNHFRWDRSDRFVLSKGHAAMAYYCLLSELHRLPEGLLDSFGCDGSLLEPHPDERALTDVHASTGSLGQGLSVGIGLALGARLRGSAARTVVLLGDGEANEGQVWEAARSAAMLGLGSLLAVIDANGFQQDGPMEAIMPVTDLPSAWRAMGWVVEMVDGHDITILDAAITRLFADPTPAPRLLWAKTVKGKGVPFLEGTSESHYPSPLSPEDMLLVRLELDRG
jgi:transketolase